MIAQLMPWNLEKVLIAVVVLAAAVALVYVALQQFGISIPPWVVKVWRRGRKPEDPRQDEVWILVVVFVVSLAIRFLFTL